MLRGSLLVASFSLHGLVHDVWIISSHEEFLLVSVENVPDRSVMSEPGSHTINGFQIWKPEVELLHLIGKVEATDVPAVMHFDILGNLRFMPRSHLINQTTRSFTKQPFGPRSHSTILTGPCDSLDGVLQNPLAKFSWRSNWYSARQNAHETTFPTRLDSTAQMRVCTTD